MKKTLVMFGILTAMLIGVQTFAACPCSSGYSNYASYSFAAPCPCSCPIAKPCCPVVQPCCPACPVTSCCQSCNSCCNDCCNSCCKKKCSWWKIFENKNCCTKCDCCNNNCNRCNDCCN